MPRKSKIEKTEEKVVEPVVIEKPKRGRKKKVKEPEPASPIVDSQPAPVKKVRRKRAKVSEETPVVVEEVKEQAKPRKKPRALKVEKTSETKPKRAPSKWMLHVAEFRKKNEGMSYRDALRKAKDSYSR